MATYQAKVRRVDIRLITIKADDVEQAQDKYLVGDWDSEITIELISETEIEPLQLTSP